METPQDPATKTQGAELDALLTARVAEMVREIDLEVAVKALKGTYDDGILQEGILNPPHLGRHISPPSATTSPTCVP